MLLLAQRHAILGGSLVFLSLIAYVWFFHLLPGLGDGIPSFNDRLTSILHPDDSSCHDGPRRHGRKKNSTASCGPSDGGQSTAWKRPADVRKIMGLVFYGRRATVSILDCYLKRNLAKNGGVLDGVIFLERTSDVDDLEFLDRMMAGEPAYERWTIDMTEGGYASSYDRIQDDVMYIKMDDDIVYIEDTVIPSVVTTRAEHPEFFVVSANVVNQPLISWIHWNLGAVRPYLPELNKAYPAPKPGTRLDWRPSLLPAWQGSDEFEIKDWSPPDHQRHRWLPVKGHADHLLDRTPIMETDYDPFGSGWSKWQVAAQEHYSLFENMENGDLGRYRFGTWDFQYRRMGIQFIAMLGKDINLAKPIDADDEHHFAVTLPQRLGRHAVADGGGVVAHFSFSPQSGSEKIEQTDILERYRSYAEEFICDGPLLWRPSTNNDNTTTTATSKHS